MESQKKINMVSLHQSVATVLKLDIQSPNTNQKYREHLFEVFPDVRTQKTDNLQKSLERELFFFSIELPKPYWYADFQKEKNEYFLQLHKRKAASLNFANAYLHYVSDRIHASIACYPENDIEARVKITFENPFKVIRLEFLDSADIEGLNFHPLLDNQQDIFMIGQDLSEQNHLMFDSVDVSPEELEVPLMHDFDPFLGGSSPVEMGY